VRKRKIGAWQPFPRRQSFVQRRVELWRIPQRTERSRQYPHA
jgi:hypothetical protein